MRCGTLVLVLGVLAVASCAVPVVERPEETQRFRAEMAKRTEAMKAPTDRPLTMAEAEAIALRNSLELSVQNLTLRLQDDNVRLALATGLPKANLAYTQDYRSNEPLNRFGSSTFAFTDRNTQALSIQATVPVLDFGLTYYAWQMAKDRRAQDRLLLQRAQQTLRRDVRIAYARHAAALRQEKLTRTSVIAAEQVLKVGRGLEREGMATRADTSLLDAAVAEAKVKNSVAQQRVEETRLGLAALLSLPPAAARFTIVEAVPVLPAPPAAAAMPAIEERALLVRPELHVQDLERHIAANDVRREFAGFFPHLDATGSFNWSNLSTAVNPAFFLGGFTVTQSLLEGGSRIWRYDRAKKTVDVEQERTLLVSLGVLYDVDLRVIQLQQARETITASAAYEKARKEALDQIISLYKEGLETEAGTAKALSDLNLQSLTLDLAITDYLVTWYAFEAAALPEEPTTQPATAPATQP